MKRLRFTPVWHAKPSLASKTGSALAATDAPGSMTDLIDHGSVGHSYSIGGIRSIATILVIMQTIATMPV